MPEEEPLDPRKNHLQVAASLSSDPSRIVEEIAASLGTMEPRLLLLFAGGDLALAEVSTGLGARYPMALIAGCTTCGEIGPLGLTQGALSALALAAPARASACLIENLDSFRFEDGKSLIQDLLQQTGLEWDQFQAHQEDFLLLTLTDGLSGMEEILITSLATYAPGVALVGGSAADDFRFQETRVTLGHKTAARSAVLILLNPGRPFHVFQTHHYETLGGSLVVTAANPEKRLIHRLDGRPATEVLAELLGVPHVAMAVNPRDLLAAHESIFGVGSTVSPFLRSVMGVQGDALLMGGAVEEGSILYRMHGGDLVESTRQAIDLEVAYVQDAVGMLLFNCGGRLHEAEGHGVVKELGQAMMPIAAAGFATYGEQFGPMQLNHTLTGVVFGRSG